MSSDAAVSERALGVPQSDRLVDYARAVLAESALLTREKVRRGNYHLPFIDLRADFTDLAYGVHCDRSFACRAKSDSDAGQVEIIVADASVDGISQPRAWWEEYYRPLEVEHRLDVAGLRGAYFHDDRIWQFYDLRERRGVNLLSAPGAYPPWEASAPLRAFLHWVYAEMGLRLVHAATLGQDGRGVLIAGPGGAGKSGTTLAGVIAGLDSVGDDYVLIDPRDSPTAYPVFRNMKQDPAGYARLRLSRFLDDPGATNWQGKHEFDFERLGRGKRAPSLQIHALLIPKLSDRSRSDIRPIKPRDAMLALSPTGIFQLPGERASGARLLADLVRSLPSFQIDLSCDPNEIGESLTAFVGGRVG
jgi:hypothetical protein